MVLRWIRVGKWGDAPEWEGTSIPDRGDTVMLEEYKWKVTHRHWIDSETVEITVQPDYGYIVVRDEWGEVK